MQNVPVGWGDAVDAVMLPMELGWNQAIRCGPSMWVHAHGGRRARTEGSLRGGRSTASGFRWTVSSKKSLTECWYC